MTEPTATPQSVEIEQLGDRTRWFMAQAWDEGNRAGHDCVGAEVRDECVSANPYRTRPGRTADGEQSMAGWVTHQ